MGIENQPEPTAGDRKSDRTRVSGPPDARKVHQITEQITPGMIREEVAPTVALPADAGSVGYVADAASIREETDSQLAPTFISGKSPNDVQQPKPTATLKSFGNYEILGEIARGGMGVVYKARHRGLNRIAALKVILAGGHAGQEDLDRFRIEAETIARLQHPRIVQIYEVGETEGLPFLSLEFCSGGNLAAKLHGTPLPPREAAELVQSLALGMEAAHQANVVHRDLKPANVLFAADGEAKITDFGLAKKLDDQGQTRTGAIMGTPSYMAPEQAEGKHDITPAADIYALGAIL